MGFTMHGDAITGAAASAEFTLYDSEKSSHTLDSTQHLEIDAISLAANGAGTIGVYITTVATGAYVFVAELTTARPRFGAEGRIAITISPRNPRSTAVARPAPSAVPGEVTSGTSLRPRNTSSTWSRSWRKSDGSSAPTARSG